MDAATVVSKLHEIDPGFREVCEALYPGLNPAEVYDRVYKSAGLAKSAGLTKSDPGSSDTHAPTPVWRNGRGNTKGRGRRKIDVDVKRIVHKGARPGVAKQAGVAKVDRRKVEHAIGLGTTGVGAGISAVALPKHLRTLPTAINQARTGPKVSEGVKNAVSAVRQYSKPAQGALPGMEAGEKGVKAGVGALKTGLGVARRNPRLSAGLAIGATALHTANLGGEAIATHVLADKVKKPKVPKGPPQLAKAWDDAQAMIIRAHQQGRISKTEALALAAQTYTDLSKAGFGGPGNLTSGNINLTPLKAPPLIKPDGPHLSPSSVNAPKPAKAQKGKSGKTSNKRSSVGKGSVKKGAALATAKDAAVVTPDVVTPTSFDAEVEFAKVDADKMQCFGWCSVVKINGEDVVDKQADVIAIEDIEKSAYDYVLGSRAGGDMHRRAEDGGVHKVADMIESFVLTPEKIAKMGLPENTAQGWWIGLQVHDPDVWTDVRNGKRTGFSIHGTGRREPILVDV